MSKDLKFQYVPLEEVAFEVQFAPKLKVIDKLSDFQDSIGVDYPSLNQEHMVSLPLVANPVDLSDKLAARWVFENEDKMRLVRLTARSFNFVDKRYVSFADYSREVEHLWNQFELNAGAVKNVQRIGLRYINRLQFPFKDGFGDIAEYTLPYFSIDRFKDLEPATVRMEARVTKDDTRMTIRAGFLGVDKIEAEDFIVYMLDYDAYLDAAQIAEEPMSYLSRLHDLIEEQFLTDTDGPYRAFMEKGVWS